MNWPALHGSKEWREFLESRELNEKIEALEAILLLGKETDPHTLGRLRGQLQAYRSLGAWVETLAKNQEAKADAIRAAEATSVPLREGEHSLWSRMRRFQLH